MIRIGTRTAASSSLRSQVSKSFFIHTLGPAAHGCPRRRRASVKRCLTSVVSKAWRISRIEWIVTSSTDEAPRHQHEPRGDPARHRHTSAGNRRAIAMADQDTLPEADGVEQARQTPVEPRHRHQIQRSWQLRRARRPIANARPGEHATASPGRKLLRKIAPHAGGAQLLVQAGSASALGRARTGHAVLCGCRQDRENPDQREFAIAALYRTAAIKNECSNTWCCTCGAAANSAEVPHHTTLPRSIR